MSPSCQKDRCPNDERSEKYISRIPDDEYNGKSYLVIDGNNEYVVSNVPHTSKKENTIRRLYNLERKIE